MDSVRSHLNEYVTALGRSPVRDLFEISLDPALISFAGGNPAPELFDVEGLAESFAAVMATNGGRAMQYSSTDGEPEMREAAAKRTTEMGVPTSPDQLIITSGSQQGLGLLSQTLINPGDVVLAENPSFVSALQAFGLQGAEFRPVDTDEAGVIPEALEAAIEKWHPKAVYLIPTFQNPTGITMSAERRRQVADVLAASDTWLIEDDPYSELRFTEEQQIPISADQRLDDRAFLCNTLSKVLSPGLRVGWVRGPAHVLERMSAAKQANSLQTSTVDQLAAAHYLAHNDLQAKLEPVRAEYRARRNAMLEGLRAGLPEGSAMTEPDGGMFVWARLPEGHDASALVYDAIKAGVVFVPGAPFYIADPDPRALRFSFVSNNAEHTREGLARLGSVFGRG
jgi:2-aminoadipate transaminase